VKRLGRKILLDTYALEAFVSEQSDNKSQQTTKEHKKAWFETCAFLDL
jgi:hypothetical protein